MNDIRSINHDTVIIRYEGWLKTLGALVDAVSAGPGVVVLVGPMTKEPLDGIGESLILAPTDARFINTERTVIRIVAMRADLVSTPLEAYPEARLVNMQPMSREDVTMFLANRCQQFGLAEDVIPAETIAALAAEADCTPESLDRFFARSITPAEAPRPTRAIARPRAMPPRTARPRGRVAASLAFVVAGSLVLVCATLDNSSSHEVIALAPPVAPIAPPPPEVVPLPVEAEVPPPPTEAPRISLGLAIPLSPDGAQVNPRRTRAAEAERLVQMAKAYLAAGQVDRAQHLIAAAAGMGNEEATVAMSLRPGATGYAKPQ
jgi:hypothetical protein